MRSAHGGLRGYIIMNLRQRQNNMGSTRKKVLIGISVERETPASVVGGPHPTGPASGATKQILPPHTVQDWFNEKTCNTMDLTLIMAEVKRLLNATHLQRRLAEWRVVDMAEVRRREMIGCGICTHSPLARHYCEQRMRRPAGIWALEEPNQNEGMSISNAFHEFGALELLLAPVSYARPRGSSRVICSISPSLMGSQSGFLSGCGADKGVSIIISARFTLQLTQLPNHSHPSREHRI